MKAKITYTNGEKAEITVRSFREYAAYLEKHHGEWKEAHCDYTRPAGKTAYDMEKQDEREMVSARD